jgi:hypothetical protein
MWQVHNLIVRMCEMFSLCVGFVSLLLLFHVYVVVGMMLVCACGDVNLLFVFSRRCFPVFFFFLCLLPVHFLFFFRSLGLVITNSCVATL